MKENLYPRQVKLDELKVLPHPDAKRPSELAHCCVEAIVEKRESTTGMQFRVRITGLPEEEDLWLPSSLIDPELIADYYKAKGAEQEKRYTESKAAMSPQDKLRRKVFSRHNPAHAHYGAGPIIPRAVGPTDVLNAFHATSSAVAAVSEPVLMEMDEVIDISSPEIDVVSLHLAMSDDGYESDRLEFSVVDSDDEVLHERGFQIRERRQRKLDRARPLPDMGPVDLYS